MRNDPAIQEAARSLFAGLVPERRAELEQLWAEHAPRFNLLEDFSQHGRFVLDAGGYRDIRVNHRVLRSFWVASFAAWEGYRAVAQAVTEGRLDLSLFNDIVSCVGKIIAEQNPEAVPFPASIPQPGSLPDRTQFPHLRAAAELAHFATGWAFLHEVQHIIHQRGGTSAGAHASPAENHAEEISCDAYATKFLLHSAEEYAREHGEDPALVKQKRELGIYFAYFAMTIFAKDNWAASPTHPAMQDRINAAINLIANPSPTAAIIAHLAFVALSAKWPNAPRIISGLILRT